MEELIMKRTLFVLTMVLGMLGVAQCRSESQKITINGHLNCPLVAHNGGTVYLLVSITAPPAESRPRQPMNLVLVLDRSGSMADERKIDYAKTAVRALVDQLQTDDVFSFVIYDDVIDVVRAARPVRNRQELSTLLDAVYPRGATNLGGGLAEGLRQVERYRDREYVNRVILLSDGLANRGVTDLYELQRMVQRSRAKSISVTTMGVGLDYNENLMMRLSESGGGNYYFIESPSTLASVFRKELKNLSCVSAQNAILELHLGKGVHLRDAIGLEHHDDGRDVTIPLGDIYSDELREVTLELEIPEGTGTLSVAKGVLKYGGKHGWFESWPSFAATAQYTRDLSEVDKNRDHETQAKADVAVSTRSVENALRALDEGRREDAARELKGAEAAVMASPSASVGGATGTMLNEQRSRLAGFQNLLKDSADMNRAKKAIQYENYQVQKKMK
jgi:Ca-activated chloride channel homolog